MFESKKEEKAKEQAEEQMKEANKVIQNSAIGRKLPKHVKNMGTEDLLKFAAFVKLAFFFPVFIACDLVCNSNSDNKIMRAFSSMATWICYVSFIDFANYFIYLTEMIDLFVVCYIATIVKAGINLVYILAMFYALTGVIAKTAVVFMAISSLYVDTVFLMYLDIHFKEIRGEKAGQEV